MCRDELQVSQAVKTPGFPLELWWLLHVFEGGRFEIAIVLLVQWTWSCWETSIFDTPYLFAGQEKDDKDGPSDPVGWDQTTDVEMAQ